MLNNASFLFQNKIEGHEDHDQHLHEDHGQHLFCFVGSFIIQIVVK